MKTRCISPMDLNCRVNDIVYIISITSTDIRLNIAHIPTKNNFTAIKTIDESRIVDVLWLG